MSSLFGQPTSLAPFLPAGSPGIVGPSYSPFTSFGWSPSTGNIGVPWADGSASCAPINSFPPEDYRPASILGSSGISSTGVSATGLSTSLSGGSDKRSVHFAEGIPDGEDYVKRLEKSDPTEYRKRFNEVFEPLEKREIETFKSYFEARGETMSEGQRRSASKHAGKLARKQLRNTLQSEYTGVPLVDPGASAFVDKSDAKTERRRAIEDLTEAAEQSYWTIRDQWARMQHEGTEEDAQACARALLNKGQAGAISSVTMDWKEQAKAAEKRAWVKVSEGDHLALESHSLPELRARLESQGNRMTDEEWRAWYRARGPRYHKLSLDPDKIKNYPENVQESLKNVAPSSIRLTDLTKWQNKHLSHLASIQRSGKESGKDPAANDKEMQEYADKHRKSKAYTVEKTDNEVTVSFDGNDIANRKVTATFPDGTTCSVQRWEPTANGSMRSDTVDASGANPFVLQDGDERCLQAHEARWRRYQKEVENEKKRVPRLTDYFAMSSKTSAGSSSRPQPAKSLKAWADDNDGVTEEESSICALSQITAIDENTEALSNRYGLDPDWGSGLSMWAMDCMGRGWEHDKVRRKKDFVLTDGFTSMAAQITSLFADAGVSTEDKPEDILRIAIGKGPDSRPALLWTGQDIEMWAAKPNWRPSTAETLAPQEASKRAWFKHELSKRFWSTGPGPLNSKRTSALASFATDALEMTGTVDTVNKIEERARKEPTWTPASHADLDWLLPEPPARQAASSSADAAPPSSQASTSTPSSMSNASSSSS